MTDLNRPAGGTSLPAGASGQLNAVGGSGPDDLWAVGLTLSADQSTESLLLEHFNGTQWQNVPFPSQDIWAVGQTQQLNGAIQTLTAQFNGTAWAVVASPDPGNTRPTTPWTRWPARASPSTSTARSTRPRPPRMSCH